MHDAVVIGAGHNGLVAANVLADAGWSVLVVEAEEEPGGAVRSGVSNNFELGFEPFDNSTAIGTQSSRPTMTGAIQSSNGNETANALAAIPTPNRVGTA